LGTGIDLGLLRKDAHSPSYFMLSRSMGGQGDIVDFCIPCNPYFPTPEMFAELGRNMETILKYYPSDTDTITKELCTTLNLHPQTVAMANGSTELLTWIDHLLVNESLATPIPTFGRWTDQPLETGKRVDMFRLREENKFIFDVDEFVSFVRVRGSRVAVVCNPNNPDGNYVPRSEIVRMLDMLSDLDLVVVDESFIDFVDAERNPSVAAEAMIRPNVVVLKSLGKNFGLHGIRFGYLVANPALAGRIRKALPKWNLNAFAEAVVFLLKEHHDAYRESLRLAARDRWEMVDTLARITGLTVFTATQGNFVLIKLPDGYDGAELRDYLVAHHGVFVRECGNKLGVTSQFLRLVVRPRADAARLLNGLQEYLAGARPGHTQYESLAWDVSRMNQAGESTQPLDPHPSSPHLIDASSEMTGQFVLPPIPMTDPVEAAAAAAVRPMDAAASARLAGADPAAWGPFPMPDSSVMGYAPNGHGMNGYATNGHPGNGYAPNGNGYAPNGYEGNGYATNGNGMPGNGYAANGYAANGYPGNGYAPNGNGYGSDGYPVNGYAPNGQETNGYPANAYPGNAYPGDGYPPNGGYPPNAYPPNGYAANGYPGNGYAPNGYDANGYPTNPNGQGSNGYANGHGPNGNGWS
jgi:histidinol-phosphate/aromatic aminotransferase/cobyric acid decarboxylase-like protein